MPSVASHASHASRHGSPGATPAPHRQPVSARAPRAASLRTLSLQEQRAALRPDAHVLRPSPVSAPDATLQAGRDRGHRALLRWYVDQGRAVSDLRDQMGRAGLRFLAFSGTAARRLRPDATLVLGLPTLAPDVRVKAVALLLQCVVSSAAGDAGARVAALAAELDTRKRQQDRDLDEAFQRLARAIDGAVDPAALKAVQDTLDRLPVQPVPDENALYRDLLLKLADDHGMNLDGSADCERVFGGYYHSANFPWPLVLDGRNVADELNGLVAADPRLRQPHRSPTRP